MNGKHFLAAHVVGDAANGDGLVDPAVLLGNNRALKSLVPLTASLFYTDGNSNGVTNVQLRQFRLHVLGIERLNKIHV